MTERGSGRCCCAGMDVSGWSPSLINGLVAIEINYLLEIARMPVVLFILRKRMQGGAEGRTKDADAGVAEGKEVGPGGGQQGRHSRDIGDKHAPP